MAEILIRAKQNTSSNPANAPWLWGTGMVVCVRPDGWPWSGPERDTTEFWIVKVPGADAEQLEADLAAVPVDANKQPTARRLDKLDIPGAIRTQLLAGPLTVPESTVRSYLKRVT